MRSSVISTTPPVASSRSGVRRFDLMYADGEQSSPTLFDRIQTFESRRDLTTEIMNGVPVEDVGEPEQSGGEG